jgi:hypothetical protein
MFRIAAGAPALTDLIAGQVQVMFPSNACAIEYIRAVCPLRVKSGKAQSEQLSSGLPPNSDISRRGRQVSSEPIAKIERGNAARTGYAPTCAIKWRRQAPGGTRPDTSAFGVITLKSSRRLSIAQQPHTKGSI